MPDSDEPKRPGMIFPETPSPEEISKRFQPYVVELGTLVYIWTRLHDHLAELFWRVTGILNGNIMARFHSPYWFFIGQMTMVATDLHESPRARALKDKDLLKEFRWYRKNASALDAFADFA